jgi:uncharacterized peroxidase-related enzyme
VDAVSKDWRAARLSPADAALCAFAEKLTRHPASMAAQDIASLRGVGFDDSEIHHAIQIVSYFNYINRIADAVHVDLEPDMAPYPMLRAGGSFVE